MAKHEVKLPLAKETKNMLQYQEDDRGKRKDSPIPTLYVSKTLFKSPDWPPFLKITVEGVDK